VETDSEHPDLAKVYDLEELTHSMHDNFREVKSLYNDANEEIFSLSNPQFEHGKSGIANDEDQLYAIFKKIRRKMIQINKLMKNYIDNYVVTEKVSTDFMKYMAEKNQNKAQEDDFSLTEILDFLEESSSTRDIQKHEQDLFVMCGMLNSFLLDKQFTLSDDKVASGYYQGTDGDSLEQTSKNSIGLSNFIANFGKILRTRIIAGKPEGEIKRVMDTEPVEVNDTDFDLYKIPFKKDPQGTLTNGDLTNTGLIDDLNKSEKTVKRPLDVIEGTHEASPNSQSLDNDLDELINVEKDQVRIQDAESQHTNQVQLVNDDGSALSNDTDQNDEFEPVLSKEELEEKHRQKMEKNEEMFEEFDKEINSQNNLEASPVNISQTTQDHTPSNETPKLDENIVDQSHNMSQDIQIDHQSPTSHTSTEIQDNVSSQNLSNTNNELEIEKDLLSNMSQSQVDNGSMLDSGFDESSAKDLDNGSLKSEDISLSSSQLESTSDNVELEKSKLTNQSDNKSQINRKLGDEMIIKNKDIDGDGLNSINPSQSLTANLSRIKLKKSIKSPNKIKLMSKSEKKRERKLNLSSFLSRKHKHFRKSSRIFGHKSFIPNNELMTRKEKIQKKAFIPISYGHSDRGYINNNIINKDNSPGYTREFRKKKNEMQFKKLNRNAFSVYGKKSWYKPKIKIFNQDDSVMDDLYRSNPMINLI